MKKQKRLNARERSSITKDIRQGIKIPVKMYTDIKTNLLKKYNLKSFQALYDYLIVSGVVYLKKDILEVVRSRVPEYNERYKQAKLARLGKAEKVDREVKHVVCMMYDRDFNSLQNFCIEEQIKKFWVIEILFEEFWKENPIILDHIATCQRLNVTERKKQISRLLNDEYIVVLPEREAEEILDRLTEKYDKRDYGGLIQEELEAIKKRAELKRTEEEVVEDEFNKKLKNLRMSRTRAVNAIAEPIDDD